MRPLLLLRSVTLGALLGIAGWKGVVFLMHEGQPARLLERAMTVAPDDPSTGVTIVFLFRPSECPRLMGVIEALNAFEDDKVRIVGALIVDEHVMPDWKVLIGAERIDFPVYRLDPGKARSAVNKLGYTGAPLLVMFDRQRRVTLATDALESAGIGKLLDAAIQVRPASDQSTRTRL